MRIRAVIAVSAFVAALSRGGALDWPLASGSAQAHCPTAKASAPLPDIVRPTRILT